MLTLYDFGNSVCCQKVRITLCAKGLDWQAIKVDLFKTEQYDPKYLKLNPKGVVPTLLHDGKPVIESTLICEYIDQTFPQPPQLIPADPWLQSRMRLWGKMVDEGLHDGVTELSFSAMFRERMKNMPPEVREKRFLNVGDPRRTDRFISTYEFGVKSPFVVHGIAAYERAFKMLEDALVESGGPWILGSNPTLADISLMPYAARLDYLALLDLWIKDRPHVKSWWTTARQWPSFKSGLHERISETEISEMGMHGPKIANEVAEAIGEVRRKMAAAMR
ncbi:MAG TPA: glutathione S-transferase family protein [Xanthobacteraceae bacterium]|jgi:glutathione S-transferase